MPRVSVVSLPGMLATSVSLTHDVLQTANRIAVALRRPAPFDLAPPLSEPEHGQEALCIVPGLGCTDEDELDLLLSTRQARSVVQRLAKVHAAGAMMASSCAGVALLAEAGLLDGRRAATSWFLLPALAQRYPEVRFVKGAMLIEDGRCLTGGAALAQGEVMLALTARYAGPDVADLCARYLLLDNRRSQQPYVSAAALILSDELLVQAERWVRAHLSHPFRLADLAEALGTTPWTLARRFQRVCGTSPSRFVQQLRAEEAGRRLALGARFDETAYALGYSDPSAMRRMLKRLGNG